MAACLHPAESIDRSRYIVDGRRALRVEECRVCGRIVRRVRSRWKSRSDRRSQLETIRRARGRRRSWQAIRRDEEPAKRLKRLKDPVLRLVDAMRATEADAKRLPQDDDRIWKYHPVARKWRRLMRRWWALSVAGVNMRVPNDEIPRSMRTFASDYAKIGAAPDVQHGRAGKIDKLKRQAVEVAPGRYFLATTTKQLGFGFVFAIYGDGAERGSVHD